MIYFLISEFKIKYSETKYFVGMQIERKREFESFLKGLCRKSIK